MVTTKTPRIDWDALKAGNEDALLAGITALVSQWFAMADECAHYPHPSSLLAIRGDSTKAGLMAAAIELRDLLVKFPDGRKTLRDFGFEPFLQHIETE